MIRYKRAAEPDAPNTQQANRKASLAKSSVTMVAHTEDLEPTVAVTTNNGVQTELAASIMPGIEILVLTAPVEPPVKRTKRTERQPKAAIEFRNMPLPLLVNIDT